MTNMAIMLEGSRFGERLYGTLPSMYRYIDTTTEYALERYLQVANLGGFTPVINELNGEVNLIDPDKTPEDVLPIAFEHYGLAIFNGLPDIFLRKMLPMISELYARKGTPTVIEYLTSLLTGVKTTVEIDPDFDENYGININLEMDYGSDTSNELPDRDQMLRIINEFMPFFCNVLVVYSYLFYESGRIRLTESSYMKVYQINGDTPKILSSPMEYTPVLNELGYLLNNELVLNRTDVLGDEPDQIFDSINERLQELTGLTGDTDLTLNDVYSYKTVIENTSLSVAEFILNSLPIEEADSQFTSMQEDSTIGLIMSQTETKALVVDEYDIETTSYHVNEFLYMSATDEYDDIRIQYTTLENEAMVASTILDTQVKQNTPDEEGALVAGPVSSLMNSEEAKLNTGFQLNFLGDFEDVIQ